MLIGEEREVVDGKPHVGLWLGQCVIANVFMDEGGLEANPIYIKAIEWLKERVMASLPDKCEVRNQQIIVRPPHGAQNGTVAIKYMIWGRAYRVMRLLRKGKKRYAKKIVGGRMKRVRIDGDSRCAYNWSLLKTQIKMLRY